MSTLYPQSWFELGDSECEPIHSAACAAAGVNPADSEISVCEILNPEALPHDAGPAAQEQPLCYYLAEAGKDYGPVVSLDHYYPEDGYRPVRLTAETERTQP